MTSRTSVHRGMHHEIEAPDETNARRIWAMDDYLLYPPGSKHGRETSDTATPRGFGYYMDDYDKLEGDWRFAAVELFRLHREIVSWSKSEVPDALRH